MKKLPRPVLVLILTLAALLWPFPSQLGAVETAPWVWTTEIPAVFAAPGTPRAHRTADDADAYFKANPARPNIQTMIAHFGTPDGVSRQVMNSLTKGSARFLPDGYTLRFLLDDGGEMHLWSAGQHLGSLVIRYEKSGKGHLLWK
jgi:hypothetical protein